MSLAPNRANEESLLEVGLAHFEFHLYTSRLLLEFGKARSKPSLWLIHYFCQYKN